MTGAKQRAINASPAKPSLAVRPLPRGAGVEIRLAGDVGGPAAICIFNAVGRKIAEKTFTSVASPRLMLLQGAPVGMYYAIASYETGSGRVQFVLIR
jgi:hypothetical protein